MSEFPFYRICDKGLWLSSSPWSLLPLVLWLTDGFSPPDDSVKLCCVANAGLLNEAFKGPAVVEGCCASQAWMWSGAVGTTSIQLRLFLSSQDKEAG